MTIEPPSCWDSYNTAFKAHYELISTNSAKPFFYRNRGTTLKANPINVYLRLMGAAVKTN